MAVLGRVLVSSAERLDLPDLLSIDSYTGGDFKYLLQGLVGTTTPYILKGFEIIDPQTAIGTQSCSVQIADSIVFYPGSAAGPFFVGLPAGNVNSLPLVPELRQNAVNYVYLTLTTFNTSADSRAFWDPDIDGGVGGEFSQNVNTESVLGCQIGVSVGSFPANTIPIAAVTVGAVTITAIEDSRQLMFRLGTGGVSPDPFSTYNWRSLPNSTYQRVEPPTTMLAGGVNPFEGADKNIQTLKEWMDAIMSKIKELGGSAHWYDDISTFSLVNSFMDFATVIQSKGLWVHSATIPGHVSWTEDIVIKSAADPRTYVLQGPGFVQLANDQVAYLDLGRNLSINVTNSPVAFINGQAYINTIGGAVGLFANLDIGDFIKSTSDPTQNFVQIVQFWSSLNGAGSPTTPALAKSISISTNYLGTTINDTATSDSGIYTAADVLISNRFDALLTTAGGNFFWLAFRSDNVESISSIVGTSLSITISTNDGNKALVTSTTPHGLLDNQRVLISGTADYNGVFQVEVASTTTFYIPQISILPVPESGTASYAVVTTSTTNGFPTDATALVTGTTNFGGAPTISGTLTKTAGTGDATITFSAFSNTGSPTYTFTVTSANATAGATYTNNGQTFTVTNTIVAGTTLVTTNIGSPFLIAPIDATHFNIPVAVSGSSDPYLATAASFGILAKSAITNSVGTSTVNGDLGESPGSTETGAITVTGSTHLGDGTAATAQADASSAYATIAALGGYVTIANDLGTVGTLSAGRYTFAAGDVHLATSGPQTLTLNGSATDVFIFKTPSTLSTGAGGMPTITLTGGALAKNVYWVVGSAATINIGVSSAGATFVGTILAGSAITVTQGGIVNGRLIATTASGTAIMLSQVTTINVPASSPSETTGTVTLAAVIVRTQNGAFTLYQGQSVPIDGTFAQITPPAFIGGTPDYALPPGYNTLAGTQNYNGAPSDSVVTRLSELTGMMADKAQDKTIKYLPSTNLTTITNTTSGSAQLITFQGPGATLTLLQPGSPGNAVVTLPSSGGISLLVNQSAYVVIDRNAASTPAIVVANTNAVPVGENVFVIAARLADTSIYIWDGFNVAAGAPVPLPGFDATIEAQDRNLKLVRGGDWSSTSAVGPPTLQLNNGGGVTGGSSGYNTYRLGAHIVAASSFNLTSVGFDFENLGGVATGLLVVKLYTDNGSGLPGTLLATSQPVNLNTVPTVTPAEVDFTFSTPYPIVSGTSYVFTMVESGALTGTANILVKSASTVWPSNNLIYSLDFGTTWNTAAGVAWITLYGTTAGSGVILAWSANANFQIPGLAESVNLLPAGNVTLTNDGDVAYVEVNRTGPGGTLTPVVAAIASVATDDNTVVFARLTGGNVVVGNNSMLLIPGESKALYSGVSDQNLALIGSSVTEATSNPNYSSRGSVNRIELNTEGALDAIARHDAEFDKYFGMFRMIAKTAGTQTRVRITGSDRIVFTGETLTQSMSSLRVSFTGAEIDFATGSIFLGDATLPLSTDFVTALGINFTPATISANNYQWYSVAAVPSSTNADNTINVQFNVLAGATSNAVRDTAPKPPLAGSTPLGFVAVQENSGGSAILNVLQANIAQLGVGAGNGSGTGLFKVRLYDPVDTTLPTGNPVTIDGVSVNAGDLVLFSNLGSGNNKIYKAVGAGTNITSWQAQFVFAGSTSPSSGDTVVVQAGTAFADQIGIFNGTTWSFNSFVRYFNGVDYWEQSSLNTVTLADNQVAPADVFSIVAAGSQNLIVDFSVKRGTTKETGTVTMTTDGTTVGIATTNVDLGVTAGITFTADISGANVRLRYTSTSTGSAGQMKFIMRRWSDASGGPAGIPSYSVAGTPVPVTLGGTGATSLTAHGVLIGEGTSAITSLTSTQGTLLNGQGPALDPIFTSSPVLGANGTATGQLTFAGLTSGQVTIKPVAVAGTWNFNLPITAGSVGQFLTSQAGGATAMTWTTLSSTFVAPTVQIFNPGSGTYTKTAGAIYIRVRIVGGGGGGAGQGTGSPGNGGNGGNTTFGTGFLTGLAGAGGLHLASSSGVVPGGAGSGGDINVNGGSANGPNDISGVAGNAECGGDGGATPLGIGGAGASPNNNGGAATGFGAGGGGAGAASTVNLNASGGGAAGGYVEKLIATPGAYTQPYVVGVAGTAGINGTSGGAGGAGAPGIIIVEEYYQ